MSGDTFIVRVEATASRFVRRGYELKATKNGQAWKPHPLDEPQMSFFGNDGRRVRAEALRAAKAWAKKLNAL